MVLGFAQVEVEPTEQIGFWGESGEGLDVLSLVQDDYQLRMLSKVHLRE